MGFLFSVLLLLLAACQGGGKDVPAGRAAIALTDDAGHAVQLAGPAQRVVSLVPSVTETIIALGAGNRIVGRTEYDRDSSIAAVPLVGRGLSPSIEAIIALRPDLVVVWASDKRGDLRGQLEKAGVPVFAFEVQDTTDAYRVVHVMGQALGREPAADSLLTDLRASLVETRSIAKRALAPAGVLRGVQRPPDDGRSRHLHRPAARHCGCGQRLQRRHVELAHGVAGRSGEARSRHRGASGG